MSRALLPRRLELDVRGGNILLDFTSAAVRGPVTEIEVDMRGGNLRLLVPDGYAVDAEEVDMRGGSVVRRQAKDRDPNAPVTHRVTVTGSVAGGNIIIQPPRPPRRPGALRRLLRSLLGRDR